LPCRVPDCRASLLVCVCHHLWHPSPAGISSRQVDSAKRSALTSPTDQQNRREWTRPGQTLRQIKHRFWHVLFHDAQRSNVTFVSLINRQMGRSIRPDYDYAEESVLLRLFPDSVGSAHLQPGSRSVTCPPSRGAAESRQRRSARARKRPGPHARAPARPAEQILFGRGRVTRTKARQTGPKPARGAVAGRERRSSPGGEAGLLSRGRRAPRRCANLGTPLRRVTMPQSRAIGSAVERCLHTAEVAGSNPASPTRT
jgi:hypothetical protein